MQTTPIELEPTSIPEWDAEDEIAGVLEGGILERASAMEAREMLEHMQVDLPRDILWTELHEYAEHRKIPLELTIPPNSKHYAFYQIELPLNILVTEKQRMVRLSLKLDLGTRGKGHEQIVAYDLFPTDQFYLKTIMTGEVNLDVSRALKYILTLTGAGAAEVPLTECFGFKLTHPFKWKSMHVSVRTSDRMSNPVKWYVTDESIQNGFTGYVIIRAPKRSIVNVTATLTCELRKAGMLGRILKSQYVSKSRTFTLED